MPPPPPLRKADQAIVHHGDENGRVGEQDFHDFVEKSIRHYKEREGRCQVPKRINHPYMLIADGK